MQERNSKQEEALFTLLMDQVARQENQQAREAMERLARDPSAAVPALSQRRCMQTIQRGLLRRDLRSAGRVLRRLAGRAAVILAVAALCFSVAFAVSPTLRSQTVRWVVETFDTHTLLRPGSRTDRSGGSSRPSGLTVGRLPTGVTLTETNLSQGIWFYRYADGDGCWLEIRLMAFSGDGVMCVDTEDAGMHRLTINGYPAFTTHKNGMSTVVCTLDDWSSVLTVTGKGFSVDDLAQVAEGVRVR